MKHLERSSAENRSSLISTRFTQGFLHALVGINKHNNPVSSPYSSHREFLKRCRRVKLAAYASMASAVGSRRAWSRAMIQKIRSGRVLTRQHLPTCGKRSKSSSQTRFLMKTRKKKMKMTKMKRDGDEDAGFTDAGKLRKLVPGGQGMELACLLDETAHYIKCLVTQVKVMRSIADFYSHTEA